ncbi:bis-aminopropyl spermidine synthase family protein, partial [Patescibacteria group bacterium]|nr:bis-aminopropyl spermidine synthase family protein [Patescibacteria group bacterium]
SGEFVVLKKEFLECNFSKFKFTAFSLFDKSLTTRMKTLRNKYTNTAKREYDQFFATAKTSANKALILKKWGVLNQSCAIALIGDDDLASVSSKLVERDATVEVFEIDNDLIKTISSISKDLDLGININKYDANIPIASVFLKKFDAVLIDPPYTINGVELFLDRAVSLLKGEGSYIFLNYGGSFKNLEKFVLFQNLLNKYNLAIEGVLYKFNKYYGATSIGSTSNLYILRATAKTSFLNIERKNIYTFNEKTSENFPYNETHIFKLSSVDTVILKHFSAIDEKIRFFCKKHALLIKDTQKILYQNQGITVNYTLSNSSLTIHTWPEFKALHLVIVTCKKIKDKNLMIETLSELFKTSNINYSEL